MSVFHKTHNVVSWDILVSTVTGYRLDGPGIEYRQGRDFPHPSKPDLSPTRLPTQRLSCLFPGSNAAAV